MRLEYSDLTQLLQARARSNPDQIAFTFLRDGETNELNWTYGELEHRARSIAAVLQSSHCAKQRVLLLYPPGLDFIAGFWGCLLAGAIAVPCYPPASSRTLNRLYAIAKDCQPAAILTTQQISGPLRAYTEADKAFASLLSVATDDLPLDTADGWKRPKINRNSIALLQYTSGSTSTPKGVMVSHGNLLHNEVLIQNAFRQSKDSIIVGWLPLYHDMGLIGNVLQPTYVGARCILMSPTSFLQSPVRWLRAISRYHATTSGGPNFSYDLCCRKITPQEEEGLDLSRWSVAFNGAEVVREETLNRFAERFAKVGFQREVFSPCYGLAEATLLVSGPVDGKPAATLKVDANALGEHRISRPAKKNGKTHTLVSSGKAAAGVKLQIVNPELGTKCQAGQVGEIWISGTSVTQGYWNRKEESERVFGARVVSGGKGPFLRTGDLGFIKKGELFVTGRLKDLIIIRGRNIYPQDIEATVERSHTGLRPGCAAAFSLETENGEGMVIVQEVERGCENKTTGMASAIRSAVVKHHEVQPHAIFLIPAGKIPKTSSGKIQRYKCRAQFIAGDFKPLAEWRATVESKEALSAAGKAWTSAQIEPWLIAKLAATTKIAPTEIQVETPISQYGIDSLAAVEMAHAFEREWGITVPVATLLDRISIRQLASELLRGQTSATVVVAEQTSEPQAPEEATDYPLTEGQKALWFLHQLDTQSTAYNLSFAARIAVNIDGRTVREAFQTLVNRHDALRTTFHSVEGVPMQRVHPSRDVSFHQFEATDWDPAKLQSYLEEEASFHFDLEQGPLFRVSWFRCAESDQVICLTAHHIISDLWSLALLIRELTSLCAAAMRGEGSSLPEPSHKYRDYVKWQQKMLAGTEGEQLRSYWDAELTGELPVLNLPTDHPRTLIQSYKGASRPFSLCAELSKAIKDLSSSKGTTVYMTLLAAFQALLYRYTGQKDILVGSPAAGRNRAEWANVCGYFVNPLVLRASISDGLTFTDLLANAKRTVLNALQYQDYPFFSLVERLQPVRDLSQSPLLQAMFVFEKTTQEEGISGFALGEAGVRAKINGVALESIAIRNKPSQFDLQFTMAEVGGLLSGSILYSPELFDEATIERMAWHWQELLRGAIAQPETLIGELPLLTAAEYRELLEERNATTTEYPATESVHRIFEAVAERYPNNVALEFADVRLTYKELNERANQIAHYLRKLGIGPERPVAVCLQRSPELIQALLGILKAGAAYVPLDTAYPQERIGFMLEDSSSDFVITQSGLKRNLADAGREIICLEEEWDAISKAERKNLPEFSRPENLAYIMYTSGSTGVPKGVGVVHQNIARLVLNNWFASLGPEEVLFQFAPVSFDASTFEIWGALLNGGKLVICPVEDPSLTELSHLLAKYEVTTLWLTAGLFRVMVDEQLSGLTHLRQLLAGGDVLSAEHVKRAVKNSGVRLINGYGPTENTTFSCCYAVTDISGLQNGIPIGKPIANTEAYVLDTNLYPVPSGVVGELYLGGKGLARGYVGRPEVTAERFVPHPYSEKEGARLYRSGDWVRWNTAGQLEFLGRKDGQVKLRGFRVELGEVEAALRGQAGVKQAVVLTQEEYGDKRLVAYVVLEKETGFEDLKNGLRKRLPDHMVPTGWVKLERLPLTANGKLDRRALPMPGPESETSYMAPRNEREERLVEIWQEVLGREQIGVEDNFFELGGHSLRATQVVARVRTKLGMDLPLRSVFEAPTVAALAQVIEKADSAVNPPEIHISQASSERERELSYAQQRLWFIQQMELEEISYNLPGAARIRGSLDLEALQRAFHEITRRHESLRTRFVSVQGEPRQVVEQQARIETPLLDLSSLAEADAAEQLKDIEWEESRTPFDLERGPLLRLKLVRLAPHDHVLLVTMHHIVSDGWSFKVLLHELKILYEAYSEGKESPLPELAIHYSDFAVWQREWLNSERLEGQLDYWAKQLSDAPKTLELPTDFPRPVVQSNRGVRQPVELDRTLDQQLRKLSQEHSVTLYMVLLAAFQALVYRYTGQQDIVVGSPIAGRRYAETEGLIGFFVNTLAMRTEVSGDLTFTQLLQKVKKTALDAYANQDVPFEKLVERLSPERDLGRTPFFQVVFGLQDGRLPKIQLGQATVEMSGLDNGTSKFDLTLLLEESAAGIQGFLEYCTDLFEPATITRMLSHFHNLLSGAARDAEAKLAALPMLSEAEQQQLVIGWNQTATDFPHRCVHELLEEQARRTPTAVAVRFEELCQTYAELDQRSNQIGRYLRKLGVGPEVRVGICVERSLEAVAGLAGVLKAGGAFVPLDPDYPAERLRYMIADAGIQVLVSQQQLSERFSDFRGSIVSLDADWQAISNEEPEPLPSLSVPENLAYVMYTSGSTGLPKGVGVTHLNIVRLVKNTGYVDFAQARKFLQFAPISFDASTFEIWGALLNGAELVVIPPGLPSLSDLGHFIRANSVDTMWLTAPLFHQMMETEAESLKQVKQLVAGGDVVSPQIAATAIDHGNVLINGYGPTENTTFTACYRMEKPNDLRRGPVPIGFPITNTQTYVLDGEMQPVPVGVAGELFTGGAGLSRGYINRPDLTAEKFVPHPFSERAGERLYRTGDLVRWCADGKLDFIGRADRQIKIRGFRIELGEIEEILRQHSSVKEAAVLVLDEEAAGKRLVAYIAMGAETEVTSDNVADFLRTQVPEYMVPGGWVLIQQLPTTANGKIDREALRALTPVFSRKADSVAEEGRHRRTPVEEILCGIWEQVLRVHPVGVNQGFFDLGGHSLLATQIMSRVEQVFAVHLPLRTLFEAGTVREMAKRIEKARSNAGEMKALPFRHVVREQPLPLSFAQQRLWFIDQLAPGSPTYNVMGAWRIQGPLNVEAVHKSLQEVVCRHESLRTRFEVVRGEPTQIIEQEVCLDFPLADLTSVPAAQREAAARKMVQADMEQGFDLRYAPLFRVKLLRLAAEEYLLTVTIHHIVFDGWSLALLTREFSELYQAYSTGEESHLPELDVQYPDFAVWQREWLQGGVLDEQLHFWKKQLSGAAALELPRDFSRPPVMSHRGGSLKSVISAELTAKLKEVSRREGVSLFMTLLAGFDVLLSRYTGVDDISVGTPIANRNRLEIENVIGHFVNNLVLRVDVSGNPNWSELLKRTRQVTLEAYQHQDLPFEKLVEELQPERDLSRTPLFQNFIGLQNTESQNLHLQGITIQEAHPERSIAKYDLQVELKESEGRVKCIIDYALDLFEEETIRNFSNHFLSVLETLASRPHQPIAQLTLLSGSERQQLLQEWNQTTREYPQQKCVHELFEAEAAKRPESIAVVYEEEELTYRDLNRQANQVAHYLRSLGVKPEERVGVCVDRGLEMTIGLLGVLKAGGVYVPLDPEYPPDRLRYMVEDCKPVVVLMQSHLREEFAEAWNGVTVVELDAEDVWKTDGERNLKAVELGLDGTEMAYIIYTSGSTGRPKGVMVEHRALLNTLVHAREFMEAEPEDVMVALSSSAFDISILEMMTAWLGGARTLILSREAVLDMPQLLRRVQTATVLHTVPVLMGQITESWRSGVNGKPGSRLRKLLTGGDSVPVSVIKQMKEVAPQADVRVMYGPTEAAMICTHTEDLRRIQNDVAGAIGRAIANMRVYVLDGEGEPVPAGVLGELYLGGIGLARGYLNRPELTAEKFIPDAHSGTVGGRLYRTGDLVRWRKDGTLEFAGRRDNQVKLRGYRIELGEVESALTSHPAVREAVVAAREDEPGDKKLVAYYVPEPAESENHVELWPSIGEYPVYDDLIYYGLTNDLKRKNAYQAALNRTVSGKVVLDVGTGADAILALQCVEAGARMVYAVDLSAEAANAARAKVHAKRLDEKIGVIHGDIRTVTLPEQVDVVVSEVFESIAGAEGAAVLLNSARSLLKPDGRMIPEITRTGIAAMTLPPEIANQPGFTEVSIHYVERIFQAYGHNFDVRLCVKNLAKTHLISTQADFERLDFNGVCPVETLEEIHLEIQQDAILHGFALWLILDMGNGQTLDTFEGSAWFPALFPVFFPGVPVAQGDQIEAQCRVSPGSDGVHPDYEISGELISKKSGRQKFQFKSCYHNQGYRQSEFYKALFQNDVVAVRKPSALSASQLRTYLQGKLPPYMVPSHFVELSELPLTVNGKVDRKALPAPNIGAEGSYVAPQTAQEELLCDIVAEVLEQPRVGLDDNFFDLGGHSLLATLVISRVRAVFGVEVPVRALFETPTVRGLAECLRQELAAAEQSAPMSAIPKIERNGDPLPLSYAQQRLWFIDQLEPGSAFYNIPLAGNIYGPLNKNALQKSFNEVVRRHEVLRSRFAVEDGIPVVEVIPDLELPIEEIDLRGLSESERKKEAMGLAEAETAIGFDLANGPLIRMKLLQLAEEEHVLLMTIHHIVSDGLSFQNFFAELGTLYEAYANGEEPALEELEIQYADFAAWQRQWLQGQTLDDQLAYWTGHLAGMQVLDLPTDHPRASVLHHRGATIRFEIPDELGSGLKQLSLQHEVTLFMFSLAVFDVLLFRYSGQEDIAVGTPIANRNRKEIEKLIGFFVNTLVLRTDLAQNPSFVEVLSRVKKMTVDAYANQDVPFEKLVEVISPERDISRTPLFQVLFAMQNAPLAEVPLGHLKLQLFNADSRTSKFDLSFGLVEDASGLQGSLEYNTDLFEPDTAQRMIDHYRTLLAGIVAEPDRSIASLPILTRSEQTELTEWNRTVAEWPEGACLPDLFEAQVQRTPEAVAVEIEGTRLSYQELDQRSNQLGQYLKKLGARPEGRVAIYLERGLDLIVGMMAVQKAGAAYVPIDPNYPGERVGFMLEDSGASALLTQTSLLDQMPSFAGQVVNLDREWEKIIQESTIRPERCSLPQNLAYVIYTSGSTGKPKGVAICHSSVVAFISWCREMFSPLELSGVLASTSICFDVSVFETLAPLSCGGTLILVGNVLDVERMANPERVKVISTVPSAMRELITMKAVPASVMTVNLAGEAVPVGLASQIYAGTNVHRVLNLYGPTEDTTYSTSVLLPREAEGSVPIGRPITNSKVYVLDAEMQPVPMGVTGEIYIGGAGLARGYLGHPDWTAEKFVPNPFSDKPGGRLYRTGDLGKLRVDGQLGYLGRNDFQVKVRGHRIELGEIEIALEQVEQIVQAVVVTREKETGEKELIAYVVTSGEISNDGVRERLRKRLPDHMVPSIFVRMESLPLTPNGKINRRALPAPTVGSRASDGNYIAGTTPLEELLSDIWAQVLGVERIGVDDDFFARGGHSLLATQVVARMRRALNINIPLTRIFETPTVAGLAKWIEQQLRGTSEDVSPIIRTLRQGPTVLSFTQKRLWFIHQLEPDGTSYNLPGAVRIEGPLDAPALEKSLKEIVRRHEALRTRFVVVNGEPRQLVEDTVTVEVPIISLEHVPSNELPKRVESLLQKDARMPFNLENGPLVRAKLLRLAEEEHVLLVTMHHIVADDWSMGILIRELSALYGAFSTGSALPLTELPIQYADFSVWQQKWFNGEALDQQLEYWKKQLAGLQPLELLTDRRRPDVPSGKGSKITFTLSSDLTRKLKDLGRQHNATLYMTLLTAYQTLLSQYSGQTDIAVGTSIAGRRFTETEGLIGCFLNMLVLRTDLSGEPTFIELLKRVKDVTLGAYAHQDLPFEKLVETLQPDRDLSRTPLFQAMLVFHNTPQAQLQLGDAKLQILDVTSESTKFDLTLFASEAAGGINCVLNYSTDLFDAESATRLAKDFQILLDGVASSPQQSIAAFSLTTEDEQQQLLAAWNDSEENEQEERIVRAVATAKI